MKKLLCSDCGYWLHRDDKSEIGQCRRRAPAENINHNSDARPVHAFTPRDHWCGDHSDYADLIAAHKEKRAVPESALVKYYVLAHRDPNRPANMNYYIGIFWGWVHELERAQQFSTIEEAEASSSRAADHTGTDPKHWYAVPVCKIHGEDQ